MFFDFDGNKISHKDWNELRNTFLGSFVITSSIHSYDKELFKLKTRWVGIDPYFTFESVPLIYESRLIRNGDNNVRIWKWVSKDEAIKCHAVIFDLSFKMSSWLIPPGRFEILKYCNITR